MISDRQEQCPGCQSEQTFTFADYCGAWLCDTCSWHLGLARCYCGWAANGGNGRAQLEEMGETIEEDE